MVCRCRPRKPSFQAFTPADSIDPIKFAGDGAYYLQADRPKLLPSCRAAEPRPGAELEGGGPPKRAIRLAAADPRAQAARTVSEPAGEAGRPA